MTHKELIEAIDKEPLFNKVLRDDVKNCNVFLAFREKQNRIDLYYEGGKLFSYDKNGFSTHKKYASVIDSIKDDYVTEENLKNTQLISKFLEGIKDIKKNCKDYAGKEAQGVAKVYSKFSYFKNNENLVVIDIEIAFEAERGVDRKGQDRIDILLLDKKNKKLIFVEAKHFSNEDLWSTKTPDVINQIKRYEGQIKVNYTEILEKYKKNIGILKEHFKSELQQLPLPECIDDKVALLIFGFDGDQKKGKLTESILKNKEYQGMNIYSIGKISEIKKISFELRK